jgi:hypothetical protein
MQGYHNELYSLSLKEFGDPFQLLRSGSWVIKRMIDNSSKFDLMGCYPLFFSTNWDKIQYDLESIDQGEIVTIFLVTDPFGKYDEEILKKTFPDVMFHFKDHYYTDLKDNMETTICKHHLKKARRCLDRMEISRCDEPLDILEDWWDLYQCLIEKYKIKGIRAFSYDSFKKQFNIPGITVFKALYKGKLIGIQIWFDHEEIAYTHLSAYNKEGYRYSASYGLRYYSMEYFKKKGTRFLSMGAGTGIGVKRDGLTFFKKGWSTGTRKVFFCGKIIDREAYENISSTKKKNENGYFPIYRKGEFG